MFVSKGKYKGLLNKSLPFSSQPNTDPNYYYENTLKVAETCLDDNISKIVL